MSDARVVKFGKRVRELRKARGLSQEAFADRVGIDRAYTWGISSAGRITSPL